MFAFILGFLMGGAAGAAIVLAVSPQFQHSGEDGDSSQSRARETQDEIRARIEEAVAIGKIAAAQKMAELEEMIRNRRRGRSSEEQG